MIPFLVLQFFLCLYAHAFGNINLNHKWKMLLTSVCKASDLLICRSSKSEELSNWSYKRYRIRFLLPSYSKTLDYIITQFTSNGLERTSRSAYTPLSVVCLVMSDSLWPHGRHLPGSSVHGISWQEHWSGWPFPKPAGLPKPGIELGSPALQVDSLPTELSGKPWKMTIKEHLCKIFE